VTQAPLTVAVTGPTGDIGRALLRRLDRTRAVGTVLGMARRPFDPGALGLRKTEYRQGDVLDRAAVDDLCAEADVVVHLAFIILGSLAETRSVNLAGSRNVFESAAAAERVQRLVYTSSVAAYGFHAGNPQPLTEDVPPRGTDAHYYSAQKAELEGVLAEVLAGSGTDAYVLRPSIVAGPDAVTLIEVLPALLRKLPVLKPVLPDPGVPFQLVHHDDVASALAAAVRGAGPPGIYNLAGDGELTAGDLARALGWLSVPIPRVTMDAAALTTRLPLAPPTLQWLNAMRVPVLMDTRLARRGLRWRPRHNAADTLTATVSAARERSLV
jgi:nucleoside-diphosphate-sugar epimerase